MKIKCPNCGDIIDLAESESAEVLKQVRTAEFEEEIAEYKKRMEAETESAVKVARMETEAGMQTELTKRDAQIAEAKAKLSAKEQELKLAVSTAKAEYQEQIASLQSQLAAQASAQELAIVQAVADKDSAIAQLQAQILAADTAQKLAVAEAVADSDKKYQEVIKAKDAEIVAQSEQVAYYRDMKARRSTKAIGESLELHCQDDYDMHLRALLPNAYFEKDNEISESGSKGDYIFREELDGIPLLSIMFEMKNDSEETETRHKNEHFFKELDKDRKEKGCEYAVLVSLLESDSDLYNQGIVDVSHKYPKMFVIRPQFLCPLITLLRNAALSAHSAKLELADYRAQNLDVTNFESRLEDFKTRFSRSCELTGKKFEEAINQIDKAIKDLERVKEALTASEKHLLAADNQLEDLTVKKLTYKNPTMKKAFDDARQQNNE